MGPFLSLSVFSALIFQFYGWHIILYLKKFSDEEEEGIIEEVHVGCERFLSALFILIVGQDLMDGCIGKGKG